MDVTLRSSRRHLQQRQPVLTRASLDAPTDTSRAWLNLYTKTWPDFVGCRWTSLGKTRGGNEAQNEYALEHRTSTQIMHLPPASYVRPSRSSLSFGPPCGYTQRCIFHLIKDAACVFWWLLSIRGLRKKQAQAEAAVASLVRHSPTRPTHETTPSLEIVSSTIMASVVG